MIQDYIFSESATLLDTTSLCNTLGVTVHALLDRGRSLTFEPAHKSYFGPVRFVYVQGVPTLCLFEDSLVESKQSYVLVVNDAKSAFAEFGVASRLRGVSSELVYANLLNEQVLVSKQLDLKKTEDHLDTMMLRFANTTVLGNIQTYFYRVRDLTERAKLQSTVFAYLGNVVKTRPETGIKQIDAVLSGDRVIKFRKAIAASKNRELEEVATEYGLDRFELQYVRVRCGLN